MTPHEVKVWNWLRESVAPLGYHFRRQVPIERFVVDFACLKARLLVEIDGEQHGREDAIREADRKRDVVLSGRGYRILRFTNRDVDREKAVVLDTILAALENRLDFGVPSNSLLKKIAGATVLDEDGSPNRRTPPRFGFADSALPSGEGSTRGVYGAD